RNIAVLDACPVLQLQDDTQLGQLVAGGDDPPEQRWPEVERRPYRAGAVHGDIGSQACRDDAAFRLIEKDIARRRSLRHLQRGWGVAADVITAKQWQEAAGVIEGRQAAVDGGDGQEDGVRSARTAEKGGILLIQAWLIGRITLKDGPACPAKPIGEDGGK